MSVPRVCVVGAGRLASRRIYPYLGAAGMRLAGVCDLDSDKARRNTEFFGGRPYTDLDSMLKAEQPDGVIVCVGPRAHSELALRIMRAGYPVYTEKPPALTVEDAMQMARTSSETGLLCMTAFKKRYSDVFQYARAWLEQFPPEDWLSVSVDYCSGPYASETYSTGARARSFLFDFAIHHLDLIHYLFGDVAQVAAYSRGASAYAVALQFTSGAVGTMHFSDGRSFEVPTEEIGLTVRGGNFFVVSNSSRWREVRDGKPRGWREPATFVSLGDSGRDTGHLTELEAFAAHLRDGASVLTPVRESLKSLVLHDGIVKSAHSGMAVPVRYP